MDREDIERLLSIHSSCGDIQRLLLSQIASGKETISSDRRGDIVRSAQRIIELAGKLA